MLEFVDVHRRVKTKSSHSEGVVNQALLRGLARCGSGPLHNTYNIQPLGLHIFIYLAGYSNMTPSFSRPLISLGTLLLCHAYAHPLFYRYYLRFCTYADSLDEFADVTLPTNTLFSTPFPPSSLLSPRPFRRNLLQLAFR